MRLTCTLTACFLVSIFSQTHATAQNVQLGEDVSRPISGVGHEYLHDLSETVDPASGNLSIKISLPVPPGRGLDLPYALTYNSGEVHHFGSGRAGCGGFDGACWAYQVTSLAEMGFGWSDTLPYAAISTVVVPISGGGYYAVIANCPVSMSYNFWDMNGEGHELSLAAVGQQQIPTGGSPGSGSDCTNIPSNGAANYLAKNLGGDEEVSAQLEAYCMGSSSGVSLLPDCYRPSPALTVTDRSGTTYSFAGGRFNGSGSGSSTIQMVRPDQIEDRNGNMVRFSYPGDFGFPVTDTVGRTLISRTVHPDPTNNNYPTANSVTVGGLTYILGYTTVSASFALGSHYLPASSASLVGCSFDGTVSVSQRSVLSSITYPNGQKYTFSYDPLHGLSSATAIP